MKSSIEWRDDAQNAAPEEKATVADVRVWLNGLNVTQHLNEGALEDHVTVALYGLAHGIAHDWWTIFGARDREISLLKYRDGYLLPDIRVRFDGGAFELLAEQKFYQDPDVRFWGGTNEVMSRREGPASAKRRAVSASTPIRSTRSLRRSSKPRKGCSCRNRSWSSCPARATSIAKLSSAGCSAWRSFMDFATASPM